MHPLLWGLLGLALVFAVAVPTGLHVQRERSRQGLERVRAIAADVGAPAPMTDLVLHHDCNGTGLVYCGWTTDSTARDLAFTVRDEVARASGRTPRVACWPGATGYSCLVQAGERGGHDVSFLLDPETERVNGRIVTVGTRYTVQTY